MSIYINYEPSESHLHDKTIDGTIIGDKGYGMYHATDNPEWYEPQRSSDFEFIVTDLDNLVDVVTGEPLSTDAEEILRLAVVSTFLPHYEVSPLEERRGNSVMRFAGKVDFNSGGTLKLRDWIGANSGDILRAWFHQVYDVNTDKVGLISDYKKNARIIQYTPDKQEVRTWILYGCWPSNISEPDMDHENNDARSIEATIQYDRAVLVRDNG